MNAIQQNTIRYLEVNGWAACPTCGESKPIVHENVVAPLGVDDSGKVNISRPMPSVPLLAVTCARCNQVRFFDALRLRAVAPNA